MTRHYIQKEVVRENVRVLSTTECDFCGNVQQHESGESDRWPVECAPVDDEFNPNSYDYTSLDNSSIWIYYGYSYGDSEGSGKELNLDVCPRCVVEKLLPLVVSDAKLRKWFS